MSSMPPEKQSARTETFVTRPPKSSSGAMRIDRMRDFALDVARTFTRQSPPLNNAFLRLLRRQTSLSPATGSGSVMPSRSRTRML